VKNPTWVLLAPQALGLTPAPLAEESGEISSKYFLGYDGFKREILGTWIAIYHYNSMIR
jgi:hypothetical protein